jgi:predicted transcriptional regulator YdeE
MPKFCHKFANDLDFGTARWHRIAIRADFLRNRLAAAIAFCANESAVGPKMDPTAVATNSFLVAGLGTRTTNRIEAVPEMARISELWRKFYSDHVSDQIPDRLPGAPEIVAVYYDYESDHQGQYSLIVGHKVSSLDHIPKSMGGVLVGAGRYLRFPVEGPIPAALIETWQSIWQFFELSQDYERAYTTDFEVYGPDETEIFIAVK